MTHKQIIYTSTPLKHDALSVPTLSENGSDIVVTQKDEVSR